MLLNKDLSGLIDTPVKIKILRYVLAGVFSMTGRELARTAKVSHSSVIRTMDEFEAAHLVYSYRAGKSQVWQTRYDSYAYKTLSKVFADIIRPPVKSFIEDTKTMLSKHKVKRAVVFGSVAGKEEKDSSDIDLFVLVEDQDKKKKMEKILEDYSMKCIELYGNTLGYYLLTENEFKSRKKLGVIKNIEKGIKII